MINDGGPAFPSEEVITHIPNYQSAGIRTNVGMSLRDWFAGQALIAVFAGAERNDGWGDTTASINAGFAYQLADAMIAERNKNACNSTS